MPPRPLIAALALAACTGDDTSSADATTEGAVNAPVTYANNGFIAILPADGESTAQAVDADFGACDRGSAMVANVSAKHAGAG